MKIILIGLTGIGNTILFLPSLKALKDNKKDTFITLLTSQNESLFNFLIENRMIDKIISFKNKNLFRIIIIIIKIFFERYDASFTLYSGKTVNKLKLFTFFIHARKRYIHGDKNLILDKLNNVVPYENIHDIQQNLNLIKFFLYDYNINLLDFYYNKKIYNNFFKEIGIISKVKNENINSFKILIGIHPLASHTYSKIWSLDNYIKLINILNKRFECKFRIFGSSEEREVLMKMQQKLNIKNVETFISLNFPELINKISDCQFFICNDSSLMHIASFSDVYVFALFGPTDIKRTHPFTNKSSVISINYPCSPCIEEKKYIKCKHFNCMKLMDVEYVSEIITKKILEYLIEKNNGLY